MIAANLQAAIQQFADTVLRLGAVVAVCGVIVVLVYLAVRNSFS